MFRTELAPKKCLGLNWDKSKRFRTFLALFPVFSGQYLEVELTLLDNMFCAVRFGTYLGETDVFRRPEVETWGKHSEHSADFSSGLMAASKDNKRYLEN